MSIPAPETNEAIGLDAIPGQRAPEPTDSFDLPPSAPSMPEARVEVAPAQLDELGAGSRATTAPRDLRLLASIPVDVTVELGRVELPLRDLITLGEGAVFELDKASDAPVDVLVNGKLVARGEVVVIDGSLGVRVISVVESSEQ